MLDGIFYTIKSSSKQRPNHGIHPCVYPMISLSGDFCWQLKGIAMWGRVEKSRFATSLGALLIMLVTPLLAFYFYIVAFSFDCSLSAPIIGLWQGEIGIQELWEALPSFSFGAWKIVGLWLLMQLVLALVPDILHLFLPRYRGGRIKGSVTPAGNRHTYQINGLQAWVVAHLLFLFGIIYLGWFSPTIVFDNWGGILWVANIIGYSLAIFVFIKAYFFPSHPNDRKFSGNWLYDFYMGIELNPRIGPLDLKLFFNGRPGIVAWSLINISFAAAQYQLYGYVTNSMILVNFLQGLYILYFFWEERWYLNTIDIHHDHFGWMLAWGDSVWLPYMYTLQGLYLVFHPVQLPVFYALSVLAFGLLGFWIFFTANNQKDRFRQSDGNTLIWGERPDYIACQYTAADGTQRSSKLLTSGWWGAARHMNYTGDLIGSLSWSLSCGFAHLFPYFYMFFITILLVHRCFRDEQRCLAKYGNNWEKYCAKVRYRLIPGVV